MRGYNGMGSLKTSITSKFRRLIADKRGIAAVEFAFIAPLLFIMYFMTMEVGQAVETHKKVGRISSMVADLITQQPTTRQSEVDAIMKIAASIIQPYNRSAPTIKVTAINISTAPSKVTVAWSRKMEAGAAMAYTAPGTVTTVPAALNIEGSFLIRVDSQLSYKPLITWSASAKDALSLQSAFDVIEMGETYYLRPRASNTIPCNNNCLD